MHSVAETILAYQTEDGWLGPEPAGDRNFWGRTPLILGFIQLVEADKEWEKPVMDAMRRYFALMNKMVKDDGDGFNNGAEPGWGYLRVADLVIGIQWLLEHHPSEQDGELWETMRILDEINPLKWKDWYEAKDYPKVLKDPYKQRPQDHMPLHGVNVGQGLKTGAVLYRNDAKKSHIQDVAHAVDFAFRYHGAPSGTMLADELQRNLAPWMGSELCMHVETAWSMSYAYQALGVNEYADRAELATFNALPAAFLDSYWAHQYMTQPNQPWAKLNKGDLEEGDKVFTDAQSGVATTFGLEPQYPCCTTNLPQGWPKFVTATWGRVGEHGLAHILLSPTKISTRLRGKVQIECETQYPFGDCLTYRTSAEKGFDLYVRIPQWAKGQIDGKMSKPDPTGLCKIPISEGSSEIIVNLQTDIRVVTRSTGAVSIYHGNLLYALEIKSSAQVTPPHHFRKALEKPYDIPNPRVRDHYLDNTTPWNIAIDPSTLALHQSGDLPVPVFEEGCAPTYMTVKGREIEWPLYLDATPDVPPKNPKATGEVKEYRLIPYGAAKLHMSEIPVIKV